MENSSQTDQNISHVSKNKLYRFAFSRVLLITLISVLSACTVISITNDMYAFVKPDSDVDFSIEEPTSLSDITQRLDKLGVVNNPFVFKLYVKSKEKSGILENFSGDLTLNSNMSYREILLEFSRTSY